MRISRFHLIAALISLAIIATFAFFALHRATPRHQLHVAILSTASHDSLAAAQRGIESGLADAGYAEGETITIDRRNADGDPARLAALAQNVVASQPDLIFAIGTPAAQAAARQTTKIPIVGAAVTDYAAARLVKSEDAPGTNVTGTSDRYDAAAAVEHLRELLPGAHTIGILYDPRELASAVEVQSFERAATAAGLRVEVLPIFHAEDIAPSARFFAHRVDVFFAPTDHLIAAHIEELAAAALDSDSEAPTIAASPEMLRGPVRAALGIDYEESGRAAAAIAKNILDGQSPARIPIQHADALQMIIKTESP
ncbi:MAG: ABC transporter substrate-binding protein [Selenomonadaceae bacterium]|nr:ABC transporter substrate-binding protein [Selenomonadaceae bacterium]